MKYPDDIDTEIVPLLDALNSIPTVKTTFSCCGHGNECWYISFIVENLDIMNLIIERFSKRTELGFKFKFFEFGTNYGNFGIYSDILGTLPDMIRTCYEDWFVWQCDKIKLLIDVNKIKVK